MRIQFCGADRTVTGSCHLVEINGLRLLLDMGLYQGPREMARRMNEFLPDDVKSADAIILSHGHLDHCGKLPVAVREGFAGPIYCTAATAAVARVVLEDAAGIQVEDAQYLNRRTRSPEDRQGQIRPLYTPADIPAVRKAMRPMKYDQWTDLGKGVRFCFHDAGHILGSAYVILEWKEGETPRRLLFTGDVGRYDTPIIRDPATLDGPMDFVITESTYGDKAHAPMAGVEEQLLDAVKYVIDHNSRLLVPSFALGRTQTMLWYIQKFIAEKRIPPIATFVDSPMGVELTEVYKAFPEHYDEQTRAMIGSKDLFGLARVTLATSVEQSKAINRHNGPAVIIASSPTCEFGRILHHLKASVEREHDMVIFVGWTPPNTLGRRLQEGQRRVRIYDRWYDLRCQVRILHGLSAHADGDELLRFLKPTLTDSTRFFVVHGEADVADRFAGRIVENGGRLATVPAMETAVAG